MVYDKNKFVRICGMPQKTLQVYILRGNVILNEEGRVDIAIENNYEFLKKWREKNENRVKEFETEDLAKLNKKTDRVKKEKKVKVKVVKEVQQKIEVPPPATVPVQVQLPPPPVAPESQEEININNIERLGLTDLEKLKKKMDILKIKEDTEIQQLKKEKMQGEVLPVDISKSLFLQHNKHLITAVNNAFNDILTRISIRYDISTVDSAKYKGEIKDYINKASADALKETEKGIKSIISEIANKRGVGERK